MNFWDEYGEFPADFLAQHHDLALFDISHQIKALLLYPLNCSCKINCICKATREKIVFSLNVNLYNEARTRSENTALHNAMRYFFKIPDDAYFRKSYGECYPLWLIEEKFQEKISQNHFKIVSRLIWALLGLAKSYELSYYKEFRASTTEAVDLILRKAPLNGKAVGNESDTYLCGEKGYTTYLSTYKSLAHFIAAFQNLDEDMPTFSFNEPKQIQEFLKLSEWVRQKLLSIQTPNIKEKTLFSEDSFLPLPPWINLDDFNYHLDPLQDRLEELLELAQNSKPILPSTPPTTAKSLRR